MLTALHIQDFVLIDQASLTLSSGLTALTGETGAGKSILLDALGLAAGGRAERGAVRAGAERGVITAVFEPEADHAVWSVLDDNDISVEDDQVILRRMQMANGKSRAYVNDQPVSISLLRKVGGALLEIHGQHDGQSFLSAATHRTLLDEFGGLGETARAVSALWAAWREALDTLEERRANRQNAANEAEYLRHVLEELDGLGAEPGEEGRLAARRSELMASEKAREELAGVAAILSEDGLEGRLSSSLRRLIGAGENWAGEASPLQSAIERVDAALSEVMEARGAVEDVAAQLDFDADELDRTEERLFALRAAARKHGVTPDALPQFHEKAQKALAALDEAEADLGQLEQKAQMARDQFMAEAEALSKARGATAKRLDGVVAAELEPLKLGRAVFSTRIDCTPETPSQFGIDHVEFVVATNPGAPAGPLKSIASGGELSRFVLAMKAALAAKESRTVIIFDEVDAGVGGAVADAIGERLSRLARDAQVLVVTHSPQVAARADQHWRVEKTQSADETQTRLATLSSKARTEEIARMLSGAEITKEARAAARKLINGARADEAGATPTRRKSA